MAVQFGALEALGGSFGGWTIVNESTEKMPQDLASAAYDVFNGRLGITATPMWYIGHQLVNGINYAVVYKFERLISGGAKQIEFAKVIINIPPNSVGGKGATIVREEHTPVINDNVEEGWNKIFNSGFVGATHKPIAEIGSQVVKGTNYHVLAQSQGVYPGAEPYLSYIIINEFQGEWHIASIAPIK